jgi:hypothetical protein
VFCFCSIRFVRLFSVQLFVYSVLFSVLILELYSRYFDPIIRNEVTCYHYQPSSKSINVTQDLHLILTQHWGFESLLQL